MRTPSRNRAWTRRPYTRVFGIGGHWWRGEAGSDQCVFTGCGEARHRHWLECGEWASPRRERWSRMAARARQRITGGIR